MNSRFWSILVGTVGTLAMVATDPALAQQVSQAGSALEEIVVTARRREEAIQTVPIAISAFSQDQLTSARVMQFNDLQHYVPSLRQFAASFRREFDQINIRSLPGSVTYIAEASTAITSLGGVDGPAPGPGLFYDLQNIQILKGPQGTLFGGLASGGAILLEPRLPDLTKMGGYAQVQFGNYNDREYEAALNVPIIADKVAVRLAMARQERDGFTTDVGPFFAGKRYDNRDHWSFRFGLLVKPTETITNYTMIDSYYRHTNGTGIKALLFAPPVTTVFGAALTSQVLAEQAAMGPRATALATDQLDLDVRRGLVDRLIWEATDNITVKNIFSLREVKNVPRYQLDGSRLPILVRPVKTGWRNTARNYTEELNLSGVFLDQKLKTAAGFYWEKQRPMEIADQTGITFGAPSTTTELGRGEHSWGRAFYGQASYDLGGIAPAIEGLSLTAGARRTTDFRQTVNFTFNPTTFACVSRPGSFYPDCALPLTPFKGSVWTFTFGADYQLDPTTLIYVARRKGYRPGGRNANVPSPELEVIQPESAWDIEVGIKKDWKIEDVAARTNVAAYHVNYDNIQRAAGFFDARTNTAGSTTQNAAKAVMEGLEFEGTLVPVKPLEISFSYAMSIAYYKSYTNFNQTTRVFENLSGLAFPSNPRHKYNVNVTYHLPVPESFGDLSSTFTYFWQGRYWGSSPAPTPFDPQNSYGLVNLRLDWKGVGGFPLDLGFFVTNLTDKTFLEVGQGGALPQLGAASGYYNEPRMYGVSVKYTF